MNLPKQTWLALPFMLLLSGCATGVVFTKADFKSIGKQYETQHYQECIAKVDAALRRMDLQKGQRDLLMLTKALCLEDTGHSDSSREIYRQIAADAPNTSISDEAVLRLTRNDGDQKAHFEVDLAADHLRRKSKQWDAHFYMASYVPEGGALKADDEMVFSIAADRPRQIMTPADALERMQAQAGLKGNRMEAVRIDTVLKDEGEWVLTQKETAGVIRVVVTLDRMCAVIYAKKGASLSPEQRDDFIKKVDDARIVSTY